MNILFICNTYSDNLPTSNCVRVVVNSLVRQGHFCRIVTKYGKIFDSGCDVSLSTSYKKKGSNTMLSKVVNCLFSYIKFPRNIDSGCADLFEFSKKELEQCFADILIASFLPIESLDAGKKLKRLYGDKIIYIPYLLDGLLSGPKLRFMPKSVHDMIAIREENKLFEEVDSVVLMEAARAKHSLYKGKLKFNGKIYYLDLPLFQPITPRRYKERKYFPQNQKIIFFAGSMARNVRNPLPFLRLFVRINDPLLHIYFAGSSDFGEYLKEYEDKDSRIHFLGVLPRPQVLEMQAETDYLLNLGNHFAGMMPSKLFEYMSTGLPIIGTTCIPDDPILYYFSIYTNSVVIDEDGLLEEELEKLDNFLLKPFVDGISENIIQKLYKNTPEAFGSFLQDLYNKKLLSEQN